MSLGKSGGLVGDGSWLAHSVERVTLNFGVVSSNPTLGIEITLKRKKKGKKIGMSLEASLRGVFTSGG